MFRQKLHKSIQLFQITVRIIRYLPICILIHAIEKKTAFINIKYLIEPRREDISSSTVPKMLSTSS